MIHEIIQWGILIITMAWVVYLLQDKDINLINILGLISFSLILILYTTVIMEKKSIQDSVTYEMVITPADTLYKKIK